MSRREAIIKDGVVLNIHVAFEPPQDCISVPCPAEVSAGWTYKDGVFLKPQAVLAKEAEEAARRAAAEKEKEEAAAAQLRSLAEASANRLAAEAIERDRRAARRSVLTPLREKVAAGVVELQAKKDRSAADEGTLALLVKNLDEIDGELQQLDAADSASPV